MFAPKGYWLRYVPLWREEKRNKLAKSDWKTRIVCRTGRQQLHPIKLHVAS